MNLKIEACRNCTNQCELENRSKKVVDGVQNGSINTLGEVRGRVSRMLQWGRSYGCPSSEIAGTQRKTFEQIDSRLVISPLFTSRINGSSAESPDETSLRPHPRRSIPDGWRS